MLRHNDCERIIAQKLCDLRGHFHDTIYKKKKREIVHLHESLKMQTWDAKMGFKWQVFGDDIVIVSL